MGRTKTEGDGPLATNSSLVALFLRLLSNHLDIEKTGDKFFINNPSWFPYMRDFAQNLVDNVPENYESYNARDSWQKRCAQEATRASHAVKQTHSTADEMARELWEYFATKGQELGRSLFGQARSHYRSSIKDRLARALLALALVLQSNTDNYLPAQSHFTAVPAVPPDAGRPTLPEVDIDDTADVADLEDYQSNTLLTIVDQLGTSAPSGTYNNDAVISASPSSTPHNNERGVAGFTTPAASSQAAYVQSQEHADSQHINPQLNLGTDSGSDSTAEPEQVTDDVDINYSADSQSETRRFRPGCFNPPWNNSEIVADGVFIRKPKTGLSSLKTATCWVPSDWDQVLKILHSNSMVIPCVWGQGPYPLIVREMAMQLGYSFRQTTLSQVTSLISRIKENTQGEKFLLIVDCSATSESDTMAILQHLNARSPGTHVILTGPDPSLIHRSSLPPETFLTCLSTTLEYATIQQTLNYFFSQSPFFGFKSNQGIRKLEETAVKLSGDCVVLSDFIETAFSDPTIPLEDCITKTWEKNAKRSQIPVEAVLSCLSWVFKTSRKNLEWTDFGTISAVTIGSNEPGYAETNKCSSELGKWMQFIPVPEGLRVVLPPTWVMGYIRETHINKLMPPAWSLLCRMRPGAGGYLLEKTLFDEVVCGSSGLGETTLRETGYAILENLQKVVFFAFDDIEKASLEILKEHRVVGISVHESANTVQVDLRVVVKRIDGIETKPEYLVADFQATTYRDPTKLKKKCLKFWQICTERKVDKAGIFIFITTSHLDRKDPDIRKFLNPSGLQNENLPTNVNNGIFATGYFRRYVLLTADQLSTAACLPSPRPLEKVNCLMKWPEEVQGTLNKFDTLLHMLCPEHQAELSLLRPLVEGDSSLEAVLTCSIISPEGANLLLQKAKERELDKIKDGVYCHLGLPPCNTHQRMILALLKPQHDVAGELRGCRDTCTAVAVLDALAERHLPELNRKRPPIVTSDTNSTSPNQEQPAAKRVCITTAALQTTDAL